MADDKNSIELSDEEFEEKAEPTTSVSPIKNLQLPSLMFSQE